MSRAASQKHFRSVYAPQRFSLRATRAITRYGLRQRGLRQRGLRQRGLRQRDLHQRDLHQRDLHQNGHHNQNSHHQKTAETITYSVKRSEAIATLNRQLDLRTEPVAHKTSSGRRSWRELTDRAFLAECKGHDNAAEILYLESLSLFTCQDSQPKSQLSASNKIDVLRRLAKLYIRQTRYAEAEPLLHQALKLRSQMALEDELVGEFAHQLAKIYRHQQRYAEADELFQRAFRLFSQYLGDKHPQTQAAYRDLMQLLMSSIEIGKFEELNAGSTPLDLENLSEAYSWAKPAWQQ